MVVSSFVNARPHNYGVGDAGEMTYSTKQMSLLLLEMWRVWGDKIYLG